MFTSIRSLSPLKEMWFGRPQAPSDTQVGTPLGRPAVQPHSTSAAALIAFM